MKKIFFVTAVLLLSGCSSLRPSKPEVVVVEKEDIPIPMQYEGKDGYWLSKSRMMMFFEIAERYEALLNNKNYK